MQCVAIVVASITPKSRDVRPKQGDEYTKKERSHSIMSSWDELERERMWAEYELVYKL